MRFCDAFSLTDHFPSRCSGFLPGTVQEYGGIIKHGSKLFTLMPATVRGALITRSLGGAYDVVTLSILGLT